MWRKLTAMLLLIVLAQTANALSHHENNLDNFSSSTTHFIEQSSTPILDNNEPPELFNLPRLQLLTPALFTAKSQTMPNYGLVIEFFEVKLSAKLFKNLANPPRRAHWFERLGQQTSSFRISGWKDGNFLYTKRLIYPS